MLIDNRNCKSVRRMFDSESVGSTSLAFARPTAFVLPIIGLKERNIDSPHDYFSSGLDDFG